MTQTCDPQKTGDGIFETKGGRGKQFTRGFKNEERAACRNWSRNKKGRIYTCDLPQGAGG